MRNIRQIFELHFDANLSARKIGRVLKFSKTTVATYLELFANKGLQWAKVRSLPDEELAALLFPVKPGLSERLTRLYAHFEHDSHELCKKGMTRELLWEEYCATETEAYSYSRYCSLYEDWCKADPSTRLLMEHTPGEEIYIDYSGLTMSYRHPEDGSSVRVELFVAILGWSQYTFVLAMPTQQQNDTLYATTKAFEFFGGAGKLLVPDCMKTAVTTACRYESIINRQFNDMAAHYGTVVVPARPGRPRDKALVENAVRSIQRRIVMPLRNTQFESIDEINAAIVPLLLAYNTRLFQRRTVSRRDLWESGEKAALKSLPSHPYEPRTFLFQTVPPTYHVEIREDSHRYSVPHRYAGKPVKIVYTTRFVEIFSDTQRIAFHVRNRTEGGRTTNEEHLPEAHRAYLNSSEAHLAERAGVLGQYARKLVTELFVRAAHPAKAVRSARGVLSLARSYDLHRVDTACRIALREENPSYRRVKDILSRATDIAFTKVEALQQELPFHENIRGADAYV
jgi:Transposase and inactivated derivatives